MRFARSILSGAFFALYGTLALLFAPALALPVWTKSAVRALIRFFYRKFVSVARLTRLFVVSVSGREYAQKEKNARGRIVAMNHISLIDIVVLMSILGDSTAIAKANVKKNPFLSQVSRKMFIINDEDPVKLKDEVAALLDGGVDVIVFPQGTRGGEVWQRGAARLALACKADILPARISYDPVVLAKSQPWWDVGGGTIKINVDFLPPVPAGEEDSFHAAKRLTARIENMIRYGKERNER